MMNCFIVWLTDERRLALFPAGSIVRDPHHRESPTHHEHDTCQSKEGPVSSSYRITSMANSAMVGSITCNVGSTSHNSTQSDHTVARSSGANAPFAGKQPQLVLWKVSGKLRKVKRYQNSLPHLSQIREGQD